MGGVFSRYYWAKRTVTGTQDYIEFWRSRRDVDTHPASGGLDYAQWKGLSIEPNQVVRLSMTNLVTKWGQVEEPEAVVTTEEVENA